MVGFTSNGVTELRNAPEFDNLPKEGLEKGKVKKKEILRIWGLTKALDLDIETAAQLFPILHKYDKKRVEIYRKIKRDIRELKDALEEGSGEQIKGILTRLEQNQRALQEINEEERAELKNILTLEQQARYVLFQYKFFRPSLLSASKKKVAPKFKF